MTSHASLQILLAQTLAAHAAKRPAERPAERPAPLAVLCLCAAWCDTCRQWQTTFEAAARARSDLAFRWIDIEDEADALGDVDVQDFPTLLIGTASATLFYGPVLPQAGQIERLLRAAQAKLPSQA